MAQFCIANIAKITKEYYMPPNDDVTVFRSLLNWAYDEYNKAASKKIKYIEKGEASKLINQQDDVRKNIKETINGNLNKMLNLSLNNVIRNILPYINPVLKNEYQGKINNFIKTSDLNALTKDDLKNQLASDGFSKLLSSLIYMSIIMPNKYVEPLFDTNENHLLNLQSGICPICKKRNLILSGKKNYNMIRIFPNNLPSTDEKEFKKYFDPKDRNSLENKILICSNDSSSYITKPTLKEFIEFAKAKKQLSEFECLKNELDALNLPKQMEYIIPKFKDLKSKDINDINLHYTGVQIKDKIPSYYTKLIETAEICSNYNYDEIKKIFQSNEENSTFSFEELAKTVQEAYEIISKSTSNYEEIFEKIKNWFMNNLFEEHVHETTYIVLTSFFIQNCEIFTKLEDKL